MCLCELHSMYAVEMYKPVSFPIVFILISNSLAVVVVVVVVLV